jgi:hypothetical protein
MRSAVIAHFAFERIRQTRNQRIISVDTNAESQQINKKLTTTNLK